MELSYSEYLKKLRGCWLGKNIGGTLGAPFESTRGLCPIDYYVHNLEKGAIPNDDLDLQLVWLRAAKQCGPNLTANELAEYWLSYIVAHWSEYGAAKNNLSMGILPPHSGLCNNPYSNSNGAWIRSEIWACLTPGHPEIAVRYAYEDAIVDHAEEGVFSAIFTAALESAAFVIYDTDKLIDTALSYIPEGCAVARAVDYVRSSYAEGVEWHQVRKGLLNKFPSGFGMHRGYELCEPEPDVAHGTPGYDAPCNIGLLILGWLYGEGDFSKSICIAVSCCEDSDCTAGTIASIMGIIHGPDAIEERWTRVVGDEIKTSSINQTHGTFLDTVTQLSKEISGLMPVFLQNNISIDDTGKISIITDEDLKDKPKKCALFEERCFKDDISRKTFPIKFENTLYKVLAYVSGIEIAEGNPIELDLVFMNKIDEQRWLELTWHIPDAWEVSSGKKSSLSIMHETCGKSTTETHIQIIPHELAEHFCDITLEIRSYGRPTALFIPIRFLRTSK